jgi:DNA-binding NtrC family response regulator
LAGEPETDLLPGLRCVELRVPPLRERAEDLLALATRLLGEIAAQRGTAPLVLTADSARRLLAYRWPGNGTELRAALVEAAATGRGELRPELLPTALTMPAETVSPRAPRPQPAGRQRALRRGVVRLPLSYRGRRRSWGPIWTLARVLGERRRHQQAEAHSDGR